MLSRRFLIAAMPCCLLARPSRAETPDPVEPVDGPDAQPRRYMMEDAYGNALTNEDFEGKYLLIYFGYTGCPDVCPTSLATISAVMDALGPLADQVTPIFVTVDPDHDTAKLMQEYLSYFDKRFVGLRGPRAYTDHMVQAFNARYEYNIPDPSHPERYSIDHTASIAFMDPQGRLIRRFPHGFAVEDMARRITATLEAKPAPAANPLDTSASVQPGAAQ